MPRFDADWIEFMRQPARRGSPSAEETLAELGLAPGQVVADVGCGPGFYTIPAARIVGAGGRVYAIDLEKPMLDLVKREAEETGAGAIVETRLSPDGAIPLADASADLTICGLVLHDLGNRAGLADELARVTRPGGRVAIMEWLPEPDETRPNRLTPDQTTSLIEAAGLRLLRLSPLGTRQYLVIADRGC